MVVLVLVVFQDGGVVVVSHDARLIKSLDCEMWICSDGTVWRFGGNFDKYRNRVLAEVEARERRVEQQMEANRKSKLERHAARLGRKRAESAHVAAEAQKKAEAEAAAGSQPAKLELTGPKNGKKAKLGIAAMMDEARKKRKEESKKKRMQEQKEKEEVVKFDKDGAVLISMRIYWAWTVVIFTE